MSNRNLKGPLTKILSVSLLTGTILGGAQAAVAAEANAEEIKSSYNILLVGTDRENEGLDDENRNGNSDAMIVANIDTENDKVSIVSFMRDLEVDIPENGKDKLCKAFQIGGAELLEKTMEDNYDIEIDNFIVEDYSKMIEIVDMLGGTDVEVRDDEIENLNMYVRHMCKILGLNPADYSLSQGGRLHLNGMQTVAFTRVLYSGNADYDRTERQRKVLKNILEKFDPKDNDEFTNIIGKLMQASETNLDLASVIKLAPVLMNISDYELDMSRVPFDGAQEVDGEQSIVPDQPATNEKIAELLK